MAAVYNCHEDIALRLIEARATPHIQDRVSHEVSENYCNSYVFVF